MSSTERSSKRALTFVATSALIVAPSALAACGGATPEPTANPAEVEETSNMAAEKTNVDEQAMEGTNVDHSEEPHTNVGPEEEGESANPGPEPAPEGDGGR
ncbi:MAG: hypothetical protein AAGA56_14985 [Myxococcota bacterium]